VLVALVSGAPRAAAIWRHLVERVRAPAHARLVRDAHKLRAHAIDDAVVVTTPENDTKEEENKPVGSQAADIMRAEIIKLDDEAAEVEKDIEELGVKINQQQQQQQHAGFQDKEEEMLLLHAKQTEATLVRRALKQAHTRTLRNGRERVVCDAERLAAVAGLSPIEQHEEIQSDPRYKKSAEEDTREVVRVMRRAAVMDSTYRETARTMAFQYLERLARNQSVLDVVKSMTLMAAENNHALSLSTDSDANHTGDDEATARDLRRQLEAYQMNLFLQTQDVLLEQRKATALLEHEIKDYFACSGQNDHAFSEEVVLLAELQGEKSATAAIDREMKELQRRSSEDEWSRESAIERESALDADVRQNEKLIAIENKLGATLQSENHKLLKDIERARIEISALLTDAWPEACRMAIADMERYIDQSKRRTEQLESLNYSRDTKIRVDQTWLALDDLTILSGCKADVLGGAPDNRVAQDAQKAQEAVILDLYRDTFLRDVELEADTVGTLETRAVHIADSYCRDGVAQDLEFGPRFMEGLDELQDCIHRLGPAAEHEVDVALEQPVRQAAPWHKVGEKSLGDWESEYLAHLEQGSATSVDQPHI
jgi:hypothetical protein